MMANNILLTILASGGIIVAIIGGIREWLSFHRERKAKKEDESIADITNRLKVIEQQNKNQSEALKFVLYDRIRFLGQNYINEQSINIDDRRILNAMHKSYHHGLNGNGDLDVLMKEVNELPLKIIKK